MIYGQTYQRPPRFLIFVIFSQIPIHQNSSAQQPTGGVLGNISLLIFYCYFVYTFTYIYILYYLIMVNFTLVIYTFDFFFQDRLQHYFQAFSKQSNISKDFNLEAVHILQSNVTAFLDSIDFFAIKIIFQIVFFSSTKWAFIYCVVFIISRDFCHVESHF